MAKYAVMTSASGGGGGIAAVRVFHSLLHAKDKDDQIDLLDIQALGGPVPTDVAPHHGGSNKIFSDTHYTVEFPGYVRSDVIERLSQYDSLNLHWCSYLLTLSEIVHIANNGTTIVFTCHDFHYFLGGCHYPHTCTSWQAGCIRCPQLNIVSYPSYSPKDSLLQKQLLFQRPNVWLTTPSNYLTGMATAILAESANPPLTIRNPLDSSLFFKSKDSHSRASKNVKILMISDSAQERRKAFPLGIEALRLATKDKQFTTNYSVELYIVGGSSDSLKPFIAGLNASVQLLGKLDQSELASVYQSVDIVFTPSLEDNWPNILVEAYACGVQKFVVGPGHGCAEFVSIYECGEISESYEAASFADAVIRASSSMGDNAMEINAKAYTQFLNDHDPYHIGRQYINLLERSR